MIEEFALRVEEYEVQEREAVELLPQPPDASAAVPAAMTAAQQLREETRKLGLRGGHFVQENRVAIALGAAGLVGGIVGGALAVGGVMVASRLSRSEESREDGSSET